MRDAFRRSIVRCACILLVFFFAFFAASASPAVAKSYSADRFDAIVRVLPDGTLDVTETVVFRFESGTFREVFREIPVRRTDGIEVVRAGMEGDPLRFGTEAGTVEVRQRNGQVRGGVALSSRKGRDGDVRPQFPSSRASSVRRAARIC